MTEPACTTPISACSAAFASSPARGSSRCAEIEALGPDPLDDGIDVDRLRERLARTRLPIKVAIMDQALLPGIGNIQASEGLFRAGIDPRRPARSLSRAELARVARGLLDSIRFTLKTFARSGADGADADIDYVEERKTPNPFLVYGRAGEPLSALPAREAGRRRRDDRPHRSGATGDVLLPALPALTQWSHVGSRNQRVPNQVGTVGASVAAQLDLALFRQRWTELGRC